MKTPRSSYFNNLHTQPTPLGFTLVELMVVIVIMATLIMLLMPNLRGSKEKAQSSICKSNLRQYGVAVNQYISDYGGYFIYPGGTINPTNIYNINISGKSVSDPEGGAQSWQNLVSGYIPDSITQDSLLARKPSVRICPAIDPHVFVPDTPAFKGFQRTTIGNAQCDISDFEDEYTTDIPKKLLYQSYFTTYAVNPTTNYIHQLRSVIPDRLICFIDWNVTEGWGATLNLTTWQFDNAAKYIHKGTTKSSTNWWQTEVGFNHGSGSDRYANYLTFDGRVDSITSGKITFKHFSE